MNQRHNKCIPIPSYCNIFRIQFQYFMVLLQKLSKFSGNGWLLESIYSRLCRGYGALVWWRKFQNMWVVGSDVPPSFWMLSNTGFDSKRHMIHPLKYVLFSLSNEVKMGDKKSLSSNICKDQKPLVSGAICWFQLGSRTRTKVRITISPSITNPPLSVFDNLLQGIKKKKKNLHERNLLVLV